MSTFFEKHGIRDDVAAVRRYVPWSGCPDCIADRLAERWRPSKIGEWHSRGLHGGDTSPVLKAAYLGYEPAAAVSRLSAAARQADGLVMTRHAPDGIPATWETIWPEIRPDTAVRTKDAHWHWHADRLPRPGDLRHPEDAAHVFGAWEMRRHIASDSSKELFHHAGRNKRGWHVHVEVGKYLFVASPKVRDTYPHDHATDERLLNPTELARHEARHSTGLAGPHTHRTGPRIDPDAPDNARRIDVHPLAMTRLADPRTQVVFAVLEGVIKADAVLSHIIDHDMPASCFDVPSVSLWDCGELAWFAATHLAGHTVVIVPDADWQKAPKAEMFRDGRVGDGNQVVIQSLLFRSKLHRLGVEDVLIAAPPACDWHRAPTGHKGVDDSLALPVHGGAGRSLADLEVLRRTVPDTPVGDGAGWRPQRARNIATVLRFLAEHADTTGTIVMSRKGIADCTGLASATVEKAVDSLVDVGAVTKDGEWSEASNRHYGGDVHDFLPRITVAGPWRAVRADPIPLGELVDGVTPPGWFYDVEPCDDCKAARAAAA